jgi:uncharacterized membrane protein
LKIGRGASTPGRKVGMRKFQKYVLTGLVTAIPLLVTWFVLDIVLGILAWLGAPAVGWLSRIFETQENRLSAWLLHPWMQWTLAVIITILGLYLLGLAASRVVGRRLILVLERILERVPFVQRIYGATKTLVNMLQTKPDERRSVVLINFPNDGMKAIGLITRVMKDAHTGQELAVVYVPTTPNPTSGYLEILPLDQVVFTEMSFDEGMSFIMTGGAIGPDSIPFAQPKAQPRAAPASIGDPERDLR